jgi:hypothetical protein
MKNRLFIQAILLTLLFLFLVGGAIYWNTSSSNRVEKINEVSRRYIDLTSSHNYDQVEKVSFIKQNSTLIDTTFEVIFYLIIILQSFFLIRNLKIKNISLFIVYVLVSLVGLLSIISKIFSHYFVIGLNPFVVYIPTFFLILQIVIWVYLNLFLFRKLAEKNSER